MINIHQYSCMNSPRSHTFKFKLFDDIDLMLKPAVGVVSWGDSSLAKCFKIVVLPLLSNPTRTILNSLSDEDRNFLKSESKPCKVHNIITIMIMMVTEEFS